jgi:AcrR family transcriptional regulator
MVVIHKTKEKIIKKTAKIIAISGIEGMSMRTLAKEVGIAQSVLYHYFPDKDELLKEVFYTTTRQLGIDRKKLSQVKTAKEMLRQRIEFQLDHAEQVVTLLKYFMAHKKNFIKLETGYIPERAYEHITEILVLGNKNREFFTEDIDGDAKVITHAINGFILEYYPKIASEEKALLIEKIYSFTVRALTKGGEKK